MQEAKEMWVWSLGWEDALEEGMEPTPVFLPAESHGQRSLASYSSWGLKESDMTGWLAHMHAADILQIFIIELLVMTEAWNIT